MALADYAPDVRGHRMTTRAKVLTFDIETRPGVYLSFGPKSRYLTRDKQMVRFSMLSWAAKWYGSDEVLFGSISHGPSMFKQPETVPGYVKMLKDLRALLDEADIVIGYNSQRFDEAKVRGELVRAGIPEPSPFRTLDLYKTTRRMGWDYSSLAETASALGLDGKTSHQGFGLWIDCLNGDPDAWALMEEYNRQDVVLTEQVADAMRPYIKDHPNLNLWAGFDDDGRAIEVCTNCGADSLTSAPDVGTALTRYGGVKCRNCGHAMRRNFVKARTTLRTAR